MTADSDFVLEAIADSNKFRPKAEADSDLGTGSLLFRHLLQKLMASAENDTPLEKA